MATLPLWVGLVIPAYLLTGLAACGHRLLGDFSRSELEAYSRRRQSQRFTEIIARHDEVQWGAECLLLIALPTAVVSTLFASGLADLPLQEIPMASLLTTGLLTLLVVLVLTAWIPRGVEEGAEAPFLFHTWPIWIFLEYLFWPLGLGGWAAVGIARRLSGKRPRLESEEEEAFEDEIRSIVSAGLRDGFLEEDAGEMIEGVIELGDADVADIMTPRSEIDALDVTWNWNQIIDFVVHVGRTRIPVYEKSIDHIIGVLYVKDLLPEIGRPESERRSLRKLLREARFAPKTLRLDELLREFLSARNHLAIVVDEYGAVEGVVTTEDVLEEIVGEIVDESDEEEQPDVVQVSPTSADASGRTHISELNEVLGLNLAEGDDFDSIGGLIIHQLGRIPVIGETVQTDGIRLTVSKATTRRVERVRVDWGLGNGGSSDSQNSG